MRTVLLGASHSNKGISSNSPSIMGIRRRVSVFYITRYKIAATISILDDGYLITSLGSSL